MNELFRSTLCPLALFVVAACSSGGSGGPSGAPAPGVRALYLSTATTGPHRDALLTGPVLAIVAEDGAANLSPNLLATAVDMVFADPAATPSAVRLIEPEPGRTWVALRFLLDAGAFATIGRDGAVRPTSVVGSELRVPIPGGWRPSDDESLELRHSGDLNLADDASGGLVWTPTLELSASFAPVLDGAAARVAAVDATTRRLLVTTGSTRDLTLELEFDGDSRTLGSDGRERTVDDFLRECRADDDVTFDGLGDGHGRFRCRSAHHRGRSADRNVLIGRIASLSPLDARFELDVQASYEGGILQRPEPLRRTVDASHARVHRGHGDPGDLGFGALQVDDLVEVEWRALDGDVVVAHEVEIEDEDPRRGAGEIEGRVVSVDVGARTIAVGRRGDDPLIVGGRSVESLSVVVPLEAAVYRNERELVRIGLTDITPADRIWIRGTVVDANTVRASWVRVRVDD